MWQRRVLPWKDSMFRTIPLSIVVWTLPAFAASDKAVPRFGIWEKAL
jgi:hypothetical protein